MIGILASTASPDPDGQHGDKLAAWLSSNSICRSCPPTLGFNELEKEELDRFRGLWWHHTGFPELPSDALDPGAVDALKKYIHGGGKLFLSRTASAYVAPLGVGRAPDVLRESPPRFFFRPGMHVEDAAHALTARLPARLTTYNIASMKNFFDLGWSTKEPCKGRVLGTRLMNGAVFRHEAVLLEWEAGRGRVAAFSGIGLNIHCREDQSRPDLLNLAASIAAYLDARCILSVKEEKGSARHLLFEESYEAALLGRTGLALESTGAASVDVELCRFRFNNPSARFIIRKGDRVIRAYEPIGLEERAGSRLGNTVEIDVQGMDQGHHTLSISIEEKGRTAHEESIPLLLKGKPSDTDASGSSRGVQTLMCGPAVIEVENSTGCAKGLYHREHPYQLNFLANETNSILANRDPAPWFGTVLGRYREKPGQAWQAFSNRSGSIRPDGYVNSTIRYSAKSPGSPLSIAWEYSKLSNGLQWRFSIKNEGDKQLEIGSLYMPASLNTYFGLHGSQRRTYCKRVMMHNLVCRRGSYLFAEPLSSRPPFLVILPRFDEGFECMWHDRDELAGCQPAWEGLLNVGIHTLAEKEILGFDAWYNGHSSLMLAAGTEKSFAMDLLFVRSYDEINSTLVQEGMPALEPRPAMVVPMDMPAAFELKSRIPFCIEAPAGVTLDKSRGGCEEESGGTGMSSTHGIRFANPGEHTLKVTTGRGESLYHFLAIPPIEDLIKARGRFIATKQKYINPGSERNHAFLMWDAEDKTLVTDPPYAFLAGGSDEACLADPVFLSAKQIFFPEKDETEALEEYIEHFLFGKVQDRNDFGVKRWVSEPGTTNRAVEGHDIGSWTDRSFNYPHVFNIYYSMYVAGKRYGMTRKRSAIEYIEMAARTALAFFEFGKCLNGAEELGNIGDRALELIVGSLEKEGLDALHARLTCSMEPKTRYLTQNTYPYASEYTFDTTGYEAVYWIRKAAKDTGGVSSVLSTILGTRGKQPFWYHFGGDVRWGWGNSKFISPDEICFNYMCALNARALMDAFMHHCPDHWFLRLAFAGSVAPWALVKRDGCTHDFCGWEPGRVRFDPWSSEMGIGIAASLFTLASVVLLDRGQSPVVFGCSAKEKAGKLLVTPADGVRRRLVVRFADGQGLRASVDTAAIVNALVPLESGGITLCLEAVARNTASCTVRLEKLWAGHGDNTPVSRKISLTEGRAVVTVEC